MSLAKLMPAVRSLSRAEKVELKRVLDLELTCQETSGSNPVKTSQEDELLRQLAAAAPLYQGPVETTAEGIRALEQVLAEARASGR